MHYLFALAILLSPVITPDLSAPRFDTYGTEIPPAAYAHYPARPVLRLEIPLQDMSQTCDRVSLGLVFYGCTKEDKHNINGLLTNPYFSLIQKTRVGLFLATHKNTCVILVPKVSQEISFGFQWSIFAHEIAHCNGLVHDSTGRGWYLEDGTKIQ